MLTPKIELQNLARLAICVKFEICKWMEDILQAFVCANTHAQTLGRMQIFRELTS